ncbi:hypothetical protein StoSoilB5_15260 [Arthrobacter sp. StoSoilB5]|nr:hypothetical protein StoSoilB5_15260 [Arthrobacter sp. StoSoilB5]
MAWLCGRPAADSVRGLVPRSLQRNGIACDWEALVTAELTDGAAAKGNLEGLCHEFPCNHPCPIDTAWEKLM